jgi:hypothetical protein
MCDVVSAMLVSAVVSVVVVVVVVVVSAGVVSFLAQPEIVNVRATSASDESAKSFRILCVHLLRIVTSPERDHVEIGSAVPKPTFRGRVRGRCGAAIAIVKRTTRNEPRGCANSGLRATVPVGARCKAR